jgi:hypothetical protein
MVAGSRALAFLCENRSSAPEGDVAHADKTNTAATSMPRNLELYIRMLFIASPV